VLLCQSLSRALCLSRSFLFFLKSPCAPCCLSLTSCRLGLSFASRCATHLPTLPFHPSSSLVPPNWSLSPLDHRQRHAHLQARLCHGGQRLQQRWRDQLSGRLPGHPRRRFVHGGMPPWFPSERQWISRCHGLRRGRFRQRASSTLERADCRWCPLSLSLTPTHSLSLPGVVCVMSRCGTCLLVLTVLD
jgi:hypothetical protein